MTYTISQLRQLLQTEQVIAYPTEAVFGLGCLPMSETAVQKLLDLKQRPVEKGLILVAPELDYLRPYINTQALNAQHWQQLQQQSAQPTTWLVPAHHHVPKFLTGQFDSIAIRLCDHPAVRQLCEAINSALTSTSANLSGLPPCKTAQQVRCQFGENFPVLDMAVGAAQNPSEIRDLLSNQLIRQG